MRGLGTMVQPEELPPHARRIRHGAKPAHHRGGTTSACAENTQATPPGSLRNRNYLRMRGEYEDEEYTISLIQELPPRTRRIP